MTYKREGVESHDTARLMMLGVCGRYEVRVGNNAGHSRGRRHLVPTCLIDTCLLIIVWWVLIYSVHMCQSFSSKLKLNLKMLGYRSQYKRCKRLNIFPYRRHWFGNLGVNKDIYVTHETPSAGRKGHFGENWTGWEIWAECEMDNMNRVKWMMMSGMREGPRW